MVIYHQTVEELHTVVRIMLYWLGLGLGWLGVGCYKSKLLHGFVHGVCLRCIARVHVAIASVCTQSTIPLYSQRFASLVAHFLECPVVFTEYGMLTVSTAVPLSGVACRESGTYDYQRSCISDTGIPFERGFIGQRTQGNPSKVQPIHPTYVLFVFSCLDITGGRAL